jgi:hypothetical protein
MDVDDGSEAVAKHFKASVAFTLCYIEEMK